MLAESVLVARIELLHDLVLQDLVELLGLDRIPRRIVAVFVAISDRPADVRAVRLRPPAVELRQIEPAVHEHFHLTEVASLIEQSHANDRHAEIARRFQLIAGDIAEPARVAASRKASGAGAG